MRAEVLFINTKQFNIKWGTPKPVRVQAPGLPGGLPIRANGSFDVKVGDYLVFIEKIAGVKKQYSINEVRELMQSMLSGLLVRWISKVGQDIFNLQANMLEIQDGVKTDLDMEFVKIGLSVVSFRIDEFSYPENVTKRADQAAEHSMVGDMNRFQQVSMVDAMTGNNGSGGRGSDMMNTMMGAQMGMMMGQQMMNNMNQNAGVQNQQAGNGTIPKFCPECGTPTNGGKFCSNCGNKLG